VIVSTKTFEFGEKISEHDFPVFNEREIRAAAGILFLIGFGAWMYAAITDDFQPMRGFGVLFMLDMFMRLFINHRYAPSMIIGRFVTRNQVLLSG
jgi:membrane protein YdbS with pleckstrin-like domain